MQRKGIGPSGSQSHLQSAGPDSVQCHPSKRERKPRYYRVTAVLGVVERRRQRVQSGIQQRGVNTVTRDISVGR
ncbi:hypothetical protein MSIMFB_03626 [Mycobacterium simulans]|uniref:Uncharacterized protein n=1 Tax=Mycobacterium simulans TaxID=627089 RepID=A0A7Z7IMX7_9MYCO|nr:hypothetical protein MSIMFB_03626 [Mycobacterium simulans]